MNHATPPLASEDIRAETAAVRVSVVIPLYNERDNVEPLLQRLEQALRPMAWPWELILVDDGSSDGTTATLKTAAATSPSALRIVSLRRNFGQTAAMQAGIDAARGEVIVTLDGDLQNDPDDIPLMIARLLEEDLDLLAGWRQQRQDTLRRRLPSRIANRLIGAVTGVRLHDYGCSLKVFRAEVLREVRLYGEMHRFIPAWVAAVASPSRIGEMVVRHHPRQHGVSKYGLSRTFRVILDLLSVLFFMRFKARPGHFFGTIGLILGAVGVVIFGWLGVDKFILGHDIGTRPLLLGGVVSIIASLQFLTTGLLAELLARVYFESGQGRQYLRYRDEGEALATDEGWNRQ